MIIRTIAVTAVLAAAFAAAPAAAVITTFANYSGVGGANIYWQKSGTNALTAGGRLFTIATPGSTTPGSVATRFTFLSPTASDPLHFLADLGRLDAKFTFLATAAPGSFATGTRTIEQDLTGGSFSFIYTGTADLVVNQSVYHTGANLLTATTFTGGTITGRTNATSGAVDGSTAAGDGIVYTSDFLSFTSTNEKDFAISMSSVTPNFGYSIGQALNSFAATTTGSFSTDPQPSPTAIVPEPAAWALLVTGFGLIGVQSRRRTRATRVAS